MLPYWLLFAIFAVAALRFGVVQHPVQPRPAAPAASPGDPWEQLGRRATLLPYLALVPALMIGFRFRVGTDWGAYVTIFEDIAKRNLEWAFSRIDPGYAAVNWAVAAVGAKFWVVNLVCGSLFMFGIVRFARQQPNPWLAIAVAVPYFIIGVGMGYSRQAVAIGLSMAGLAVLSKTSFTRFAMWVLAGALFHRTAVILLPIVAISYARNRFQVILLGVLATLVGYYMLTLGQGLEQFQRGYINRVYESQGAIIRLAMNLPPALIYLGFSRRFTADETERKTWRNLSLIAVVSFIGYFFIASSAPLDRMALYVIPLQLFVLSRLPQAFPEHGRSSSLLLSFVLVYSAVVEFVWLNFSNNAQYWLPYRLFPIS